MRLELMTFMARALAIAFLISLGMLGSTYAATYYVSKSGSNSNSCATAQNPGTRAKLTIATGAACMSTGDTLLIQAGTYDERMTYSIGFPWRSGSGPSARTRYARYQNDQVIIQPSTTGDHIISMYQRQNIELDGLIIDASNIGPGGYDGIRIEDSNGIRVVNSEVRNSPYGLGIGAGGDGNQFVNNHIHHLPVGYGIYYSVSNGLIEGNTFHDLGGYAIHHYSGSGGLNNNIIRNNIIYATGFKAYRSTGEFFQTAGVIITSGTNNQFYNNVLYGNYGGLQIWASNIQAYNNTFYNNGPATDISGCVAISSGSNNTIRNNICYQNANNTIADGSSGPTVQSNNLTSNPMFVDAANANFHLQGASPAIDGGLTISTVITDRDGKPRPQGAAYDIGAYEYSKGLSRPTSFRIVSNN